VKVANEWRSVQLSKVVYREPVTGPRSPLSGYQ